MSESLQPHGLQPTRFLHPWDFPGKSTGVGCLVKPKTPSCFISLPTSHQKSSDDLFLLIPTISLKYLHPLTCSNQGFFPTTVLKLFFVKVTKDTHHIKSNDQFSLFLFLDFYTAFDMGPPSLKELLSFDFRNALLPWIYS